MQNSSQAVLLLLIYFLVTFGYTFSLGFYYLSGFILLVLAFLLLAFFYFSPRLFENFKVENPQPIFAFGAVLSIALSLVAYGGLYQTKGALFNLSLLLLAFALLISLTYLFQPPAFNAPALSFLFKNRFFIFLAIAFLLRLFMLISSPNPAIDVFDILKNGPKALLAGQNPYSVTFNKIYTDAPPDYFAYPPGALIYTIPFSLILNDPRYVFVLAELLTAFLIFSLTRSEFLSIFWLFTPRSLFMLEQSWLDSLISSLLLLVFYLWVKLKKETLALVILGSLMTVKQSLILLPLLAFKQIGFKLKHWLIIGVSVSLIILPFLVWNPADFINKTVTKYFEILGQRQALLQHSLTLNSFWLEQFQKDLPNSFLVTAVSILLLAVLLKQKKGWPQFFLATTLFYFGMFLFSKMAFLNFYYFIGQMVLTTIAVLQTENDFSHGVCNKT